MKYISKNTTLSELLSIAEYERNDLAIEVYEATESEIREEIEEGLSEDSLVEDGKIISKDEIASTCVYILTQAEWVKHEAGYYTLGDFHSDYNIKNNHVEITPQGNRQYTIVVEYGEYGENHKELVVEGLANAKEKGKLLACEAAGEAKLFY